MTQLFQSISLLITISLSANSFGLSSPILPTVPGITLPNTHEVPSHSGRGRLLRSQAPQSDRHYEDLMSLEIDRFIIFKSQTKKEVDKEIAILTELGYNDATITHIPFPWRQFESFKTACSQTIEALRLIIKAAEEGETILFHCTVGEDRTGYLAGLYRLLQGEDLQNTFHQEMCEHGYAAGNPKKPYQNVVLPIRQELTPLFLKMAYKISRGQIRLDKLSTRSCSYDPAKSKAFQRRQDLLEKDFRCQTSSLVAP